MLAQSLRIHNPGVEIFGTRGSRQYLIDKGLENIGLITEVTGNEKEDYCDHLVATISSKYILALLAIRSNPKHMEQLKELGITPIDMVVCNLYLFEKKIAEARERGAWSGEQMDIARDNTDIGGPAMIRSGAKNHEGVVIVTNRRQYDVVDDELRHTGSISYETRARFAKVAFETTLAYDKAICEFLAEMDKVNFGI